MARAICEIVRDVEAFTPINGQWQPLDDLVAELWQQDFPTEVIPDLLRVFERFPDEHAAPVLWSILLGLETRSDYENALRESIGRKPSYMGDVMLGRLVRSKQQPEIVFPPPNLPVQQ